MQLQSIERVVLNNIGMRYDELSIATDAKEILDFAILHTCVNLAREEIKLNTTKFPALNTLGAAIAVVSGTPNYNLPTGFDIPIAIYFYGTGLTSAVLLTQIYSESLPVDVPVTLGTASATTGTPDSYLLLGALANLIQIYLYPTPSTAGSILPIYKPVLTELTLTTDEDVIMRKYPKVVIDFATAFAWAILKKDHAQHDKYYTMGLSGCLKIDFREMKADSRYKDLPDKLTRNRRAARLSR